MPEFIFEAKSQLSLIPNHSLYCNSVRNNKLNLPTNFYAAQTCIGLKSYTCFTTTWSEQKRCYTIRRKDYNFPELKPEDLEEEFVRGSGPGGQSVNTTSNCVVLKHIPTGIVVKCHESRSLDENRKRARLRLEEKLDLAINGDHSFLSRLKTDAEKSKREKKRRNSHRLALKSAFKKREGLDESQ
ncbi:peptide chain release factor 1 [Plakobranchus ocellatus]|uniref:Peptide chain release factor 1 n=1 Tax=Plakobranchus ocellatus TaxID=259542 RepID=A0AAV4B363_9GAST|nr:peptide chain release factor 1 [Plakobranchus ocellatus]